MVSDAASTPSFFSAVVTDVAVSLAFEALFEVPLRLVFGTFNLTGVMTSRDSSVKGWVSIGEECQGLSKVSCN